MANTPTLKTQLESLDRLQRIDHDALIRVEEVVKSVAQDVKDLKDGTTQRLAEIEQNIKNNALHLTTLEKRVDSWESSLKAIRWLLGIVSGAIAFVLANLSGIFDVFRK